MLCNVSETARMIFPPEDKRRVVTTIFSCQTFVYFGHKLTVKEMTTTCLER